MICSLWTGIRNRHPPHEISTEQTRFDQQLIQSSAESLRRIMSLQSSGGITAKCLIGEDTIVLSRISLYRLCYVARRISPVSPDHFISNYRRFPNQVAASASLQRGHYDRCRSNPGYASEVVVSLNNILDQSGINHRFQVCDHPYWAVREL